MARTNSDRRPSAGLSLVSCGAGAHSPLVSMKVIEMFERLHALRLGCHVLANPRDAYGLGDPRIALSVGQAPTEAQRAVRRMQYDELTRNASGLWRRRMPDREYPVPFGVARGFARA